jgi:hypothetical protein
MKLFFPVGCLFAVLLNATILNAAIPLVNHGDTWRYRTNVTAPPANWQTMSDASLDATWRTGQGGFGYGDAAIVGEATTLTTMINNYRSICIRRTFNIASAIDTNLHLQLLIDYDDGYAVWLDGALLTSNNIPANSSYTTSAPADHEASCCNTPNPATILDLGPVLGRLAPGDHILAIAGWNQSISSSDFHLIPDFSLEEPPPPPTNGVNVSGAVAVNTTWYATNSPYRVVGNVTVNAGITLTIEPGVEVWFSPGLGIVTAGRLLAEGQATNKIIFTRTGTSGTWNQLEFTANSTTSRITHAEMRYFASAAIEAANTSIFLDSIVWTNSTIACVDLHTASITLLNSYIPGGAGNEPVHFSGMPANGHAIIKGCVFGAPLGYNDSIDFTGGNRPGPIVQFIDNVFLAGVDDCFDMDATDAHIEGNIFMNVLQDDERESSSNPIATGEGGTTSELVISRNIFYNCEHTVLLKDGGAVIMQNNTTVHLVTNRFARTANPPGGQLIPPGILLFGEPWRSGRTPGTGALYDGNIAFDLHPMIQTNPFPLYSPTSSFLVVSRSLIQGTNWPGVGNISSDPLFVNFTGPMTAANIRSNLALQAGSPCIGTGPNGLDMGALVPAGASLSGVPIGVTTNTSATIVVAGPGIYAYRWKLNDGPWSAEVPLTNSILITTNMFANALPIQLTGLTNGSYTLYAIGKNSAGAWQGTNEATVSTTWTVNAGGTDTDNDGLPNDWEIANGTNPLVADADEDLDGDGASNFAEYIAGTAANDPGSFLKVTLAPNIASGASISFQAVSNRTYTLQYRDSLSVGTWNNLTNIPAQPANGVLQVQDLSATNVASRYYRMATPGSP